MSGGVPRLRGFTHVSLSVKDLMTSAEWYQRVLGLRVLVPPFEQDTYRETILSLPNGTGLCLQQHTANSGADFDERRTGLDHLSFDVPSKQDLEHWVNRFDELGVSYSREPDSLQFGSMVVFRDPDNIQLELHCRRPQ